MHRTISENKIRVCFVMNCYLRISFFPKLEKQEGTTALVFS
jgi:hypothetical protein